MPRKRSSEEQIIYALRQVEAGVKVGDVCRQLGVSEQTYYRWKSLYAGLGVSELRRLKQLEEENASLKRLVADLSLDKRMLQEVLEKKSEACTQATDRELASGNLRGQSQAGVQAFDLLPRELLLQARDQRRAGADPSVAGVGVQPGTLRISPPYGPLAAGRLDSGEKADPSAIPLRKSAGADQAPQEAHVSSAGATRTAYCPEPALVDRLHVRPDGKRSLLPDLDHHRPIFSGVPAALGRYVAHRRQGRSLSRTLGRHSGSTFTQVFVKQFEETIVAETAT